MMLLFIGIECLVIYAFVSIRHVGIISRSAAYFTYYLRAHSKILLFIGTQGDVAIYRY